MTTGFMASASVASPQVLERLSEEIAAIEAVLYQEMRSDVGMVETVGLHTLSAGGKRLRPALVTLSASATGQSFDPLRTHRIGACMELIHMATLVHDDVIDHAQTRRGRPTAASVFGNTVAILSGDAMLAKAMRILADDGDLAIIRRVSGVVVDLAEGEILELSFRNSLELSVEDHFEVLRRKTATFIQACCGVGAMASEANAEKVQVLEEFGLNLGMAFQLADDLLDFEGDPAKTGKLPATDFQEGCATLPILYLLETATGSQKDRLLQWFGKPLEGDDLEQLKAWLRDSGTIERARREAVRLSEIASDALDALPPSDDVRLLKGVANLVVSRNQ